MHRNSRPSGIPALGDMPWGSHICQFYRSREDLLDILVPWFKAGLENNEFCMWVTSAPLTCAAAEAALRQVVRDFDARLASGQLLILPHDQWYLANGTFDSQRVLKGWMGKLSQALANGYQGLRLSGNTFWLESRQWRDFAAYEAEVDAMIARSKVLALCTYPLDRCGAGEMLDVVRNHSSALIRRDGEWDLIENQARRRAIESQVNYEFLFGHMIDGFACHEIVCDHEGRPIDYRFLEINSAFENITGLQRADVIGRLATEVIPGLEAEPADWVGRYGKVALTGEPARFEQYSAALGKWFSISAYSPRTGYFAVTFEDITERKQNEKSIRDLNAALERQLGELEISNRELESFAYSVSHDLIAPLRSINGFCHILLEEQELSLNPEAKALLDRVQASSRHMAGLIDALLQLSRLTRADLRRIRLDGTALARKVVDELRQRDPERRVAFHVEEGIEVEADPVMFRVALENLFGNAWKFTASNPEAQIAFSCRRDNGQTVYCVRDNGVGFDMAHAGHLFVPFHRLHAPDEFPGLGIGLATVQRIVQRHGGQVWAEATPDRGATFYFRLGEPAAHGALPTRAPAARARRLE